MLERVIPALGIRENCAWALRASRVMPAARNTCFFMGSNDLVLYVCVRNVPVRTSANPIEMPRRKQIKHNYLQKSEYEIIKKYILYSPGEKDCLLSSETSQAL